MKKEIWSSNNSNGNYINIPEEMKALKQWCLWKLVHKIGRPKPTKIPLDIIGEGTSGTTAANTFEAVIETLEAHPGRFDGIGFSLQEHDNLIAIDYDSILNDAGEIIDSDIQTEIERLNSYTEISPSGKGLHVFVKGTRAPDMKAGKRRGCRELYFFDRYLTITGRLWKNSTPIIREIEPELLKEIYRKVDPPKEQIQTQPAAAPAIELEDYDLLNRIRNNSRTRNLFAGSTSGYNSPSEADAALCCHLAFYTRDPYQIDRLFRMSGLMRPKWNERRGQITYGQLTVQNALKTQTKTYDPFYKARKEIESGRIIAERLFQRRQRPCRN